MKKSELKKLINEIVQRKLNESNSLLGPIEAAINDYINEKNQLKKVEINDMEHNKLPIIKYVIRDGVLYIDVETRDLNEITATVGSSTSGTADTNPALNRAQEDLKKAQANQAKFTAQKNKNDQAQARIDKRVENERIRLMRKKTNDAKKLGDATQDVLDAQAELDKRSARVDASLNERNNNI